MNCTDGEVYGGKTHTFRQSLFENMNGFALVLSWCYTQESDDRSKLKTFGNDDGHFHFPTGSFLDTYFPNSFPGVLVWTEKQS